MVCAGQGDALAMSVITVLARLVMLPIKDYTAALSACFHRFEARAIAIVGAAFVVTWWVYVPVHELAHALGCWLGGGEVTRLEISPVYGAATLHKIFPFVAVGSDYAGQLTGFDTHGNDLTYLLTDFLPFVLTVVVGVPLLRRVGRRRAGIGTWIMLGAALPIAYAPFISLFGDYYEMGSILTSRAVRFWSSSFDATRWRSDDLFKLAGERLAGLPGSWLWDLAGISISFVVGTLLALLTYWLGVLWADLIGGRRAAA